MKKIILILLIIVGCSTYPIQKTEFKQTKKEIENILKLDKNLTPEQKIVLRHAIVNLKDADKISEKNTELTAKVINQSGNAGVGKFMYWILGILGLGIVAYIMTKIMKIFG